MDPNSTYPALQKFKPLENGAHNTNKYPHHIYLIDIHFILLLSTESPTNHILTY